MTDHRIVITTDERTNKEPQPVAYTIRHQYEPIGWWHHNTNTGKVHQHPAEPGRGWSAASHRLCQPVYKKNFE